MSRCLICKKQIREGERVIEISKWTRNSKVDGPDHEPKQFAHFRHLNWENQ